MKSSMNESSILQWVDVLKTGGHILHGGDNVTTQSSSLDDTCTVMELNQVLVLGSEGDGKRSLLRSLQATGQSSVSLHFDLEKTVSAVSFSCIRLKHTSVGGAGGRTRLGERKGNGDDSVFPSQNVKDVEIGVWILEGSNNTVTKAVQLALSRPEAKKTVVLIVVDLSRPFQIFAHLENALATVRNVAGDLVVPIAIVGTKSDLNEQTARRIMGSGGDVESDFINFVQFHLRKFAMKRKVVFCKCLSTVIQFQIC